jgi:hypothetical protein
VGYKFLRWARVILFEHPNGQPHHFIRAPVEVHHEIELPSVTQDCETMY